MNQPRSKLETVEIPQFSTGLGVDRSGEAVALIARMAKEDGSALTELHEMWSPVLLGAACRMLGDRREAEEAVQDTFVRMWHRSADYDPKQSPPFVWAFAVMRGYCIDRLRYRHRSKRDSSRVVPIHLHAPPEEIEDARVMALDDWRRVRAALSILDTEERRCLELAVFLEYTHSEISTHLGTPLGTVKTDSAALWKKCATNYHAMNSDPHESAAWRAFGMLDADESAGFDEAMRHDPKLKNAYREMDCLAAAIAATTTVPVPPRVGQLERLHARLGLNASKRTNWFGISGWAAAAALTVILVIDRNPNRATTTTAQAGPDEPSISDTHQTTAAAPQQHSPLPQEEAGPAPQEEPQQGIAENQVTADETEGKAVARVETKRLIQEIEVLRDQLEHFQERDRKRFEPVPGMSWPIVMRMTPPPTAGAVASNTPDSAEYPPMTAILGDGLTGAGIASIGESPDLHRASMMTSPKVDATAIPIYDTARDTGTLVVSNLPEKAPDERYNLWVTTEEGGDPVYVGRLPDTDAGNAGKVGKFGAGSFDFSLGATGIVPSGFILTKDGKGNTASPSSANIILQGPR